MVKVLPVPALASMRRLPESGKRRGSRAVGVMRRSPAGAADLTKVAVNSGRSRVSARRTRRWR